MRISHNTVFGGRRYSFGVGALLPCLSHGLSKDISDIKAKGQAIENETREKPRQQIFSARVGKMKFHLQS